MPAEMPVRLPDGLDPAPGVFFANLETALNVVHDAPLRLGETALVFGQGVVGLLVTQLLKRAGAERVLAVEPAREAQGAGAPGGRETRSSRTRTCSSAFWKRPAAGARTWRSR